jgi:hypothetical protein
LVGTILAGGVLVPLTPDPVFPFCCR